MRLMDWTTNSRCARRGANDSSLKNAHLKYLVVTFFSHFNDSFLVSQKIYEDEVAYIRYRKSEVEKVMIYIVSNDARPRAMVKTLAGGKLCYNTLHGYGNAWIRSSTFNHSVVARLFVRRG